MKFELENKKYIIKFGYFYGKRTNVTQCVIYPVSDIPKETLYYKPVCESLVLYPENKIFEKDKARRIALKQALKYESEEFRMEAWNSYFIDTNLIYLRTKKYKNND